MDTTFQTEEQQAMENTITVVESGSSSTSTESSASSSAASSASPSSSSSSSTPSSTSTTTTSTTKTESNTDTKDEYKEEEGYKVFVGGLSWDTTDEGLVKFMKQFGPIGSCMVMRTPQKTSRGFGFCFMKTKEALDAATSAKNLELDKRRIDIKVAIPKEQMFQSRYPESSKERKTNKIFIGGLHIDVTSGQLKDYFSKYGAVKEATIMCDHISNRSRGFGFVIFESEATADKVCDIGKHSIAGKECECKKAEPKLNVPPRRGGDYYERDRYPSRGGYDPRDRYYDRPYYDEPYRGRGGNDYDYYPRSSSSSYYRGDSDRERPSRLPSSSSSTSASPSSLPSASTSSRYEQQQQREAYAYPYRYPAAVYSYPYATTDDRSMRGAYDYSQQDYQQAYADAYAAYQQAYVNAASGTTSALSSATNPYLYGPTQSRTSTSRSDRSYHPYTRQ
eukprot:TRINITY_DN640_c0_g1_i1.p1 TRINITY_DN640_c0_g1~~TRINITY_DN640_c0_g1_i1.p1  ORF type:complete len:456 (+),score=135.13 TRINITY_DN640_c0_g1_i1:22-1368(+)